MDHRLAIFGRMILPGCQAAIAPARLCSLFRIDRIQIFQYRSNGFGQAVNVQPVEADLPLLCFMLVVIPEPVGEGEHIMVAPHPGGKTDKAVAAPRSRIMMANIAINAGRVGPVRLDRHNRKSMIFDQLPGDGRPCAVELGSTMRCFTEEHHLRVAIAVKKLAEIRLAFRLGKQFGVLPQCGNQLLRWRTRLSGPVNRLVHRLSIPELADVFGESRLDVIHFAFRNMVGDDVERPADRGDRIIFRTIPESGHHGIDKLVLVPDIG